MIQIQKVTGLTPTIHRNYFTDLTYLNGYAETDVTTARFKWTKRYASDDWLHYNVERLLHLMNIEYDEFGIGSDCWIVGEWNDFTVDLICNRYNPRKEDDWRWNRHSDHLFFAESLADCTETCRIEFNGDIIFKRGVIL